MNIASRMCHFAVIATLGFCFVLSFAQPAAAEELNSSVSEGADVNVSVPSAKPLTGANVIDRLKALHATGAPLPFPLPGIRNWKQGPETGMGGRGASSTPENPGMHDPRMMLNASSTIDMAKWEALASSTRAHFAEQIRNLAQAHDVLLQKRTDELTKIKARVSDAHYGAIKNILERLGNAQDKLSDLLSKIEDSLSKAASAGKDVTAAQNAITAAETDLTASHASIDALSALFETSTASSTSPKAHIDAIRAAVTTAVQKLQAAWASIMQAVEAVRAAAGIQAHVQTEAQTSVETNN